MTSENESGAECELDINVFLDIKDFVTGLVQGLVWFLYRRLSCQIDSGLYETYQPQMPQETRQWCNALSCPVDSSGGVNDEFT